MVCGDVARPEVPVHTISLGAGHSCKSILSFFLIVLPRIRRIISTKDEFIWNKISEGFLKPYRSRFFRSGRRCDFIGIFRYNGGRDRCHRLLNRLMCLNSSLWPIFSYLVSTFCCAGRAQRILKWLSIGYRACIPTPWAWKRRKEVLGRESNR